MSTHRFREGDVVQVSTLRKVGTVIETLHGGSYRVAVGPLTIVCKASELSPGPRNETPRPAKKLLVQQARPSSKPSTTLDLHGLTVDEATRRLEQWLSDVIVAGVSQVKVVHGLGTGRVQRACHELLSRLPVVRAFRVNDANPGETDVYL